MALTINIVGDGKAIKEFAKSESDTIKDVRVLTRKTVDDIKDTAQEIVATNTGALGISVEAKVTSSGLAGSVQATGGDKFYSVFVEYGTFKDRAQPFMRPAFDKHEPRYANGINKIINRRF